MRLPCPHCGERDAREFSYLGDGSSTRPAGDDAKAMFAHVYLRPNPAGVLTELWYHGAGCHAWLVVERDTRDHRILSARPARAAAAP